MGEDNTFKVDYIKGALFRVIHAVGAIGGITPRGYIQLELFNERPPIPQQSTYQATQLGDGPSMSLTEVPELRVSRDAFIREVEVGVVIPHAARSDAFSKV